MIDTNVLRGRISEKGLSQRKVAKILGMTEKTFYSKMKRGVFDSDEIDEMIELLDITDPVPIFFAQIGARQVTKKKQHPVLNKKGKNHERDNQSSLW